VPGLASAYERTADGGASLAEPLDPSYKWAGGGLCSNARDLARLGSALLDSAFLPAAALELLTTSQTTAGGRLTGVAIGWNVGTDARGRRLIYHAGSIAGGRAALLVYPDLGVAVAATSNQALAPLLVESTAQVLVEPFLLVKEGKPFDVVRMQGRFAFTWTARGAEFDGVLRCGASGAADRIDLHPELGSWSAGLGSPVPDDAPVLPVISTGETAFVPIVTPAGAMALDVTVGAGGALLGAVVGRNSRVNGPFRAERTEIAPR
jgi:CubicO group peptidase (beta-lactamase class C family)